MVPWNGPPRGARSGKSSSAGTNWSGRTGRARRAAGKSARRQIRSDENQSATALPFESRAGVESGAASKDRTGGFVEARRPAGRPHHALRDPAVGADVERDPDRPLLRVEPRFVGIIAGGDVAGEIGPGPGTLDDPPRRQRLGHGDGGRDGPDHGRRLGGRLLGRRRRLAGGEQEEDGNRIQAKLSIQEGPEIDK